MSIFNLDIRIYFIRIYDVAKTVSNTISLILSYYSVIMKHKTYLGISIRIPSLYLYHRYTKYSKLIPIIPRYLIQGRQVDQNRARCTHSTCQIHKFKWIVKSIIYLLLSCIYFVIDQLKNQYFHT